MLRVLFIVLFASTLGGCATLSKDELQPIDVRVFDLDGHQVDASCRLTNGAQTVVGNAPLFRVPVSRSGSDLVIECARPGTPVARAVAVSRSSGALAGSPWKPPTSKPCGFRSTDWPPADGRSLRRRARFHPWNSCAG